MTNSRLIADDFEMLLEEQDRKGMVRLLTAGSVDDGKSTLIGRLLYDTRMIYEDQLAAIRRDSARKGGDGGALDLSLLTDGLRAEREQGITIDVAYRYFSTLKRKFIIADCPGHEQYTRNMATGASNCDLAVILVDARHGVVRQTKRHSFIVSLLGIKHVVVAVNKMDLVDHSQEVFDTIVREYANFATRLELPDLRFIPVSALLGDNVVAASTSMPWYGGETLLHYLETVHIASDRNLIDMRFPVQLVNRPNLDFRGYCGTVASGVIRRGDDVVVLPSGAVTRIESVIAFEGEVPEAFPPMAVTVTLADDVDVSRGDVLVHPGNLSRLDNAFEAMIVWMDEEPMALGKQYVIRHTTNTVNGQVASVRYRVDVNTLGREPGAPLAMNEVGRCTVRLTRKICFDPYASNHVTGAFILVDRSTNRTAGAGMIVDRATSLRSLEDHWDRETLESLPTPALSRISSDERARMLGHRPVTLLLTGLSGSGKTTLAYALERRLFDAGLSVCVLDGRRMRQTVSRDLGFSESERSENLRRATDVARVLNDAGLICLAAFVAPSAAVRNKARQALGPDRYLEVHVSAPLDLCRARDTSGIYKKADSEQLTDVPGVSFPYEQPERPDLVLETDQMSVGDSVDRMLELLRDRGVITPR